MKMLNDEFPMMMEVEVDPIIGMPRQNCPPVGVAFGFYPQLDSKATAKAGHEVYKEAEYVQIAVPGDKHSLYFQPADDRQRKRFPRAYQAFKDRGTKPVDGLPIEQWPPISRSTALTLKAGHIHTVEALAAVHDGHLDKFPFDARALREKARLFIAAAKDGAAINQAAEKEKKLQDQIAALQAQMLAMQANLTPKQKAEIAAAVAPPVVTTKPAIVDDVEADVVAAARRPRARRAA